jgi:protein gp37
VGHKEKEPLMAEKTAIEWTDRTWSPWEGCTKVSPGCDHCYAAGMNRWLHKGENWGPGAPRLKFSDAHWDKLNQWNDAAAKRGEQPKVFPSMCDPLDNEVHAGLRDRFWRAIENTPALTWLVLTKRIGNAKKLLPQEWLKNGWPKNLWLGATVVNQTEANRDIPKLLAVPARVRFLSVEPMLGPISLTEILVGGGHGHHEFSPIITANVLKRASPDLPHIDWVICGGESGPGARPMHPDWARSLRDQCAAAGVAFMMKQMGGVRDKRGALEDLPEDLRVREFPQ